MAAVEQEPIEILLVEDNGPDLDLTMEALQSGKLHNRIHIELQCNCCINKPVDLPQFMHVVRAIEDFWLSVVQLPVR